MKKIRVGMLGCGSMGKYVIDAFEAGKVPNAEIAVVCDAVLGRRQSSRGRHPPHHRPRSASRL